MDFNLTNQNEKKTENVSSLRYRRAAVPLAPRKRLYHHPPYDINHTEDELFYGHALSGGLLYSQNQDSRKMQQVSTPSLFMNW